MPMIKVDKIGYGIGKKDYEMVKCVRAVPGETGEKVKKNRTMCNPKKTVMSKKV